MHTHKIALSPIYYVALYFCIRKKKIKRHQFFSDQDARNMLLLLAGGIYKSWGKHLSEAIKMYQYCYFILTVWGYTAMVLLPGRFVYIFEFISEPKNLMKTLSNRCFLLKESPQKDLNLPPLVWLQVHRSGSVSQQVSVAMEPNSVTSFLWLPPVSVYSQSFAEP